MGLPAVAKPEANTQWWLSINYWLAACQKATSLHQNHPMANKHRYLLLHPSLYLSGCLRSLIPTFDWIPQLLSLFPEGSFAASLNWVWFTTSVFPAWAGSFLVASLGPFYDGWTVIGPRSVSRPWNTPPHLKSSNRSFTSCILIQVLHKIFTSQSFQLGRIHCSEAPTWLLRVAHLKADTC